MAEKKSKLAEIKTKQTSQSVEGFINTVKEDQKRTDSFVLLELMKKESGGVFTNKMELVCPIPMTLRNGYFMGIPIRVKMFVL